MFRILIVDDDPFAAKLLHDVMKTLHRPHEVLVAKDGLEALQILHRQGSHRNSPRPNLILLDLNMPRLSGLETLSAIKNDSELRVIPVIVFSSSRSPEDVRRSYLAHANCYVQKPIDLDRSIKLVQAVEAFWMDFALPPAEEKRADSIQFADYTSEDFIRFARDGFGPRIAPGLSEERSRANHSDEWSRSEPDMSPRRSDCEEHNQLLDEFGEAVHELVDLHQQQFRAITEGDTESHRFDLLIHMANERKQLAKYSYLRHVETHGCSNTNVIEQART
jgi:CheY-like chemotaxis protein